MKNKSPSVITEEIYAKHTFSQDELLDLSRDLGRTCSEINQLEQQKSAVGKDFAARKTIENSEKKPCPVK